MKPTHEKNIASVTEAVKQLTGHSTAELCSDEVLFTIVSNGNWLYQNSPLPQKFARMFSGILHCIQGEYFLITPVEKVKVVVESWPMVLVEVDATASGFCFRSTLDTEFNVDKSAIELQDSQILVHLSRGLVGVLNRACYYRYINDFLSVD
ncbi:DUF1285 domain-containing protein [Shewanella gaetbuli]|uniref:DUF1285 domain-containing protein n=1 Tax=Shewanella gaetbuli TaxID=220752 RepID=A0A9X1ZMK4_9GAMM|nr:DUF1285 domain-containing protein [Shewanella gaetbuli]MCL1142650.1 DUF1285 domain-containing protein [Shewanella gaetbuli]